MKIKISKRATHALNELMLLQNVSGRVWQNLVAFSSVVNRQDFFNKGSCMRPFQDCTEQPAAAVAGSNGLITTSFHGYYTYVKQMICHVINEIEYCHSLS